ncbi:hypothetical protein B0H13DRAFT_1912415 [Mycena leptocephala]|nr:hypothetical protein B0H13DRAFT_1912415 [Mycena leptocephala]
MKHSSGDNNGNPPAAASCLRVKKSRDYNLQDLEAEARIWPVRAKLVFTGLESPEVAKDRGLAGSDLTIAPKRSLALGLTLQEAAPSCWLFGDGEAPSLHSCDSLPTGNLLSGSLPFHEEGAKLNVDPTMVMSAHTSAQDKNSDTTEECTSIAARRLVTEAMRVRQENMPILGKNIAELKWWISTSNSTSEDGGDAREDLKLEGGIAALMLQGKHEHCISTSENGGDAQAASKLRSGPKRAKEDKSLGE